MELIHSVLKEKKRFFYPILIVVLTRSLYSILFYNIFDMSSTDTAWMIRGFERDLIGDPSVRWPFLFISWDSGWYLIIAFRGYFAQAFAFFPGYPVAIYLFNFVMKDYFSAAAFCSLVFGVAWIPIFQAIAEHYMTQKQAIRTTLLAAFFPYVYLFTAVAYSESLFLFASVASWYFFLKEKTLKANFMAAIAAITRIVGILIIFPMFLDLFYRREYKRLLFLVIPLMSLFSWFFYCFVATGDWFASLTAQKTFWNMYAFPEWVIHFISTYKFSDYTRVLSEVSGVILIGLTSFSIYLGRKADWRLTLYSIVYFLVILYFASIWSISRYLSFIFPIWIGIGTRTSQGRWQDIVNVVVFLFFIFIVFFLWHEFLMLAWVA